VPCGDCRGCCTSSYFIHVRPDEKETLAHIPKKLLFAAPGLPKGNLLMGYNERGHCPMFVDNQCSIYAHRPQTCRDYDCRVFPATGLSPGDEKPLISRQADRWKFAFTSPEDRKHLAAVRAAAKFLRRHADLFPEGFVPANPTQQAVLALRIYEVFLDSPPASKTRIAEAIVRNIREAPPHL
jgi:Fe-S-cluster containining protein